MFLSGLPLLCDEAYIPLFDGIYYDIGDGQSIDDDLSTFSSHISNISNIISKASSKSLVIFDELGRAYPSGNWSKPYSDYNSFKLDNGSYGRITLSAKDGSVAKILVFAETGYACVENVDLGCCVENVDLGCQSPANP